MQVTASLLLESTDLYKLQERFSVAELILSTFNLIDLLLSPPSNFKTQFTILWRKLDQDFDWIYPDAVEEFGKKKKMLSLLSLLNFCLLFFVFTMLLALDVNYKIYHFIPAYFSSSEWFLIFFLKKYLKILVHTYPLNQVFSAWGRL